MTLEEAKRLAEDPNISVKVAMNRLACPPLTVGELLANMSIEEIERAARELGKDQR